MQCPEETCAGLPIHYHKGDNMDNIILTETRMLEHLVPTGIINWTIRNGLIGYPVAALSEIDNVVDVIELMYLVTHLPGPKCKYKYTYDEHARICTRAPIDGDGIHITYEYPDSVTTGSYSRRCAGDHITIRKCDELIITTITTVRGNLKHAIMELFDTPEKNTMIARSTIDSNGGIAQHTTYTTTYTESGKYVVATQLNQLPIYSWFDQEDRLIQRTCGNTPTKFEYDALGNVRARVSVDMHGELITRALPIQYVRDDTGLSITTDNNTTVFIPNLSDSHA